AESQSLNVGDDSATLKIFFPLNTRTHPRGAYPFFFGSRMVGDSEFVAYQGQLRLTAAADKGQYVRVGQLVRHRCVQLNVARINVVGDFFEDRCGNVAAVLVPSPRILYQYHGAVLGRMRREIAYEGR